MAEKTTRQQVEELVAKGKTAAEIAEALGKTKATIYSHLRNIEEAGGKTNKSTTRGRPRADAEDAPAATDEAPKPRPNPRAKTGEKVEAKAKPAKPNVFTVTAGNGNGHSEVDVDWTNVISVLTAEKAKHEAAIQKIDTAIAALA
jgi:biotin operon repressor